MIQDQVAADVITFEDLRSLATARQPCLTAAVNIPNPLQLHALITKVVRQLEKRLDEDGIDPATAATLMQPIQQTAATIDHEGLWSASLSLFRAPDIFLKYVGAPIRSDIVAIGARFQIRPILPLMSVHQRFAVLALNQKQVRLFLCTARTCDEINLDRMIPRNLLQWMNTDPPDHLLANRLSGVRAGSMQGVVFTTSSDREKHDEYLKHFFKEIDRRLPKVLGSHDTPLVVFGVEYENVLYREVSEYPGLEAAVEGSPDGLTAAQVHAQAMASMARRRPAPLRKALADWDTLRGAARTLEKPNAIVKAAAEGRVFDLLIREGAQYRGVFNEATMQVEGGANSPGAEDLLNYAALQTLAHGGRVYELGPPDMPSEADAAALLRF